MSSSKESNPYVKVWNSVEEEEANKIASEWVFVPTWEEIAFRHKSVTRNLLLKARELFRMGKVTESRSIFNDALTHRKIARFCLDKHLEVLLKSR